MVKSEVLKVVMHALELYMKQLERAKTKELKDPEMVDLLEKRIAGVRNVAMLVQNGELYETPVKK